MPPKRTKTTRASIEQPAAVMAPTQHAGDSHTPLQSPSKRAATITQAQKQALIDNLQLEITERARKLRAQYAMQAQGLRTRLEMRVNRIPMALRKRNMADLVEEFARKERGEGAEALAVKGGDSRPERESGRGLKRHSNQISTTGEEDKENAPATSSFDQQDLANPKKRTKTGAPPPAAAAANTKATRAISRSNPVPSNVLSPKSHNSRTLPKSPFKQDKPNTSHAPLSPTKPAQRHPPSTSPAKFAAPPSRAPSRQTKPKTTSHTTRGEGEGRSSGVSEASATTTIVHNTKPPATAATKKAGAAASKKAPATTKSAAGRKPAAGAGTKKENVAPSTAAAGGGRTLRKRG